MAVKFPFNEAKATEAAAHLLGLAGSRMDYLKLLHLLYLVDREALVRFGRPVTTDQFVLTSRGPSLSQINDLITVPALMPSVWGAHISPMSGDFKVDLITEVRPAEISDAERELIEAIYANFGSKSEKELTEQAQELPEWQDPEGTKIPLHYRDVLKAGGKSSAEATAIMNELESLAGVLIALEPWHSGASV